MKSTLSAQAAAPCGWLLAAMVLVGCASTPPTPEPTAQSTAPASPTTEAPQAKSQKLAWTPGQSWHTYLLPSKKPTTFSKVQMDGRDAVLAVADSSASLLRQQVRIPANELNQVKFSWKVPQLIEAADFSLRDGDDSPVRIVLTFEGNRSNWSTKNAMLSELSQLITGEELPYATLMYVWCNKRAPGSIIHNPRTDRIRKMVVESGTKNLNQWLDYERNIAADFEKAFGEKPGALVGMALMTDSDNTRSQTRAYYGPISYGPVSMR
jgi:Protein of unknown function (DUF3047)